MQKKMNNHQDCAHYPKDDMEAIWHPYKVNLVAIVESPCDYSENIGGDKRKPHDPINNAIYAHFFWHPVEATSAQSFEPIPMPDNMPGNASEPHHSKKDMGSYPFSAEIPPKNTFQLVGYDEPKQEASNDRD
jgi:hypothetical protein